MITIKSKVSVQVFAKRCRTFTPLDRNATAVDVVLRPKIQRITRLMPPAICFDKMIRSGEADGMAKGVVGDGRLGCRNDFVEQSENLLPAGFYTRFAL